MKVVVAPDKFKGSLSATEACQAIQEGIHNYNPNIEVVINPMADGGEGSLEILKNNPNTKSITATVYDPLFRKIKSEYLYNTHTHTAFIEMSKASGMNLLKSYENNCGITSTFGTGQLIDQVMSGKKVEQVYLFLGGSATNDAGIGMAGALGYSFIDNKGKTLAFKDLIGNNLGKIKKIIPPAKISPLRKIRFTVVIDVDNPLFGKKGAAFVFAPQKGANSEEVKFLDKGLRNIGKLFGNISNLSGSGAAGGLGAGALFFLKAKKITGVDFFIQKTNLATKIKDADWVISGEGSLDKQTQRGKVVSGIASLIDKKTNKKKRPAYFIICGQNTIPPRHLKTMGIDKVYSLTEKAGSSTIAMSQPHFFITQITKDIITDWQKNTLLLLLTTPFFIGKSLIYIIDLL